MTREYKLYLQSDEWKQKKAKILSFCDHCIICKSKHNLQLHHRRYKRIFNERGNDLIVLCGRCHKTTHIINERLKAIGIKNALSNVHKKMKQFRKRKNFNGTFDIDWIVAGYDRRRKRYWEVYNNAMKRKATSLHF